MHKPPCKDCNWWLGRRVDPNCHDTCKRYLEWRDELHRGQKHRTVIEDYITEVIRKHKTGGQR